MAHATIAAGKMSFRTAVIGRSRRLDLRGNGTRSPRRTLAPPRSRSKSITDAGEIPLLEQVIDGAHARIDVRPQRLIARVHDHRDRGENQCVLGHRLTARRLSN